MRKRARAKAEGEEGAWVVDVEKVEEVLGIPRYAVEEAEKIPEVGVVTGLAWTSTGGDIMLIEALRMPGTGRMTVTGQLGDVMRESVDAAYSYVRSRATQLGIDDAAFKESDLHIHLPAGAIPKDGPSAGITLTLAIASALSGRPVRRDVAMTGEVTLRGKVLEIGGVKEKVLAAYRSGLRQVIMPKSNEKDLRDVPDEVKKNMTFHVRRSDGRGAPSRAHAPGVRRAGRSRRARGGAGHRHHADSGAGESPVARDRVYGRVGLEKLDRRGAETQRTAARTTCILAQRAVIFFVTAARDAVDAPEKILRCVKHPERQFPMNPGSLRDGFSIVHSAPLASLRLSASAVVVSSCSSLLT